jgi:[protein-PII] uridylyltransferase
MLDELRARLEAALADGGLRPVRISRRMPRQVRMFSTPVQISTTTDPANERTVIELVAADRPGLLYQVGQVFDRHGIHLQNAKVATIGERAEDVFFVTTQNHQPLDENESAALKSALIEALSEPTTQATA